MKTIYHYKSSFTLIEIIAVLLILAILAAIAFPKYLAITTNAKSKALNASIEELNSRESLTWADTKITNPTSWKDALPSNTDLGEDYTWAEGDPKITGGTISFKDAAGVALTRSASTETQPAYWSKP